MYSLQVEINGKMLNLIIKGFKNYFKGFLFISNVHPSYATETQ